MFFFIRIKMIVYLFTLFSLIKTIYCLECYDDGREFCINQDDILSVDLLPGSFLLMDREANDNISRSLENDIIDGSLDKAFDEISFHRQVPFHIYIINFYLLSPKYLFLCYIFNQKTYE